MRRTQAADVSKALAAGDWQQNQAWNELPYLAASLPTLEKPQSLFDAGEKRERLGELGDDGQPGVCGDAGADCACWKRGKTRRRFMLPAGSPTE